MKAHHHIAAAWRGQGGGRPPASQLISLQHLKPKLLQVLHLDAQHSWPDFWVAREGAAWDFALSPTRLLSAVLAVSSAELYVSS